MDQQLLAKTFVELADNLVADFDLIDFLRLLTDRCVGILDASAAGVLLADRDGKLRVMAASDEQVRLLELFQLQNDEGPCLDCFRTGAPVIVHDLTREVDRWPCFVTAAHRSGFGAVQALPMRLRDETVGALNLFRAAPGPFDPAATLIAQALADVATISLLQQRTAQRSTVLNEQLQTALNSRVLIEQAKGKLAERQGIDMEQAFQRAARLRPRPQPAPGRGGPHLHRRLRTPCRSGVLTHAPAGPATALRRPRSDGGAVLWS